MSRKLFSCVGGHLALPDAASVLLDRRDGGNLVVLPPRKVWERSGFRPRSSPAGRTWWFAAGRAMLEVLPQLEGGCINCTGKQATGH